MANAAEQGFKQRIFSCEIRLQGSINNTVVLGSVTRDELKLLAYLHGAEALPADKIKYLGMFPVPTFNPDEGAPQYVASQDDEYRRLARKYDSLVNTGRGKEAVEKCFNVHLIDFDAIIDAVDPRDAADAAIAEAEARAAATDIAAAGAQRDIERGKKAEQVPQGLGSAVAALAGKFVKHED